MNDILFQKFLPILADAAPINIRDPRLLLDEADKLKVYYAPFEFVNPEARVVLVGITPGPTQMVNANNEAQLTLRLGLSAHEVMKRAKLTASFSGEPMRSNLIKQLEHWGVPEWLGINSASSLFGQDAELVQLTSLLRFPTFASGKYYSGSPDIFVNKFLRKFLYEHFVEEARQLPNAIFFGLGPKVNKVLDRLVLSGDINQRNVASGLLHPSGNNTYRITYLVGERNKNVPHATNPETYDTGRKQFQSRLVA